jgi:hypothetical protein
MDGKDRAQATATFSEMLPGTEALWLTDGRGARYTSELRLVAIHRDDLPEAARQA